MSNIDELLLKTSRTFALAIPRLPEPTRTEVGISYLLFRIIDTFEDSTAWSIERRRDALARFPALLVDPDPEPAHWLAEECRLDPPVEHPGYRELLGQIPLVVAAFRLLSPAARGHIHSHLQRSAEGMSGFVARMNVHTGEGASQNLLELGSVAELRAYCYTVAGIVGEMLTELFLLDRPQLVPLGPGLRACADRFGEGLQLVNILKDANVDAAEGRVYLPAGVPLDEVCELAAEDLRVAAWYTDSLRAAGADRGLVAFNALIVRLATESLQLLRQHGPGAKLSRMDVARIVAEVMGQDTAAVHVESA